MSDRDLVSLVKVFTPYEASQLLLAETGLSDISKTLFAGTSGLAVQALVTGSVLQLVHRYFRRQARIAFRSANGSSDDGQDPPLARAGVIWLTGLCCLHVVVVYIMNARVLLMSQQFTAGYLMDFWLAQISNLIFTIVLLPIFVFFAFRAWNLWSRRKAVMVLCLGALAPAFGLGLVAAVFGLQHPYPLEQIDNSAFAAWLPFVETTISKLQWITLGSSMAQFSAACLFSALICTGLFAHRNCCAIMPGFAGKLAFVAGESLIPLVVTSGAILVGDILTKANSSSIGPLISRAVHSCAPAIYFHCLMNSLTSAQRQRDSLRSSISHHGGGPHGEKGEFAEDDDRTFNPTYHPDDLDTPLQVELNPKARGFLPFIFGTKPAEDATSSLPTSAGAPTTAAAPYTIAGYAIPTSFAALGSIPNPFSRAPEKGAEETQEHYNLRTAGQGRRSSLARALSAYNSKPVKPSLLRLPSAGPKLGRRESEQIFVAHEEFEGLPRTPGDLAVELADIEEGGSEAAVTPRYFTPPRLESPSFGGEWNDKQAMDVGMSPTATTHAHLQDEEAVKSPESVYEAQLGKA